VKQLLALIFIFSSQLALSHSSSEGPVQFWCDPAVRLKGLEAVLIRTVDGKSRMEVYTESRRWGAVDAHYSWTDSTRSSEGELFVSENNKVQLMIESTREHRAPGFYNAQFVDERFGFDAKMTCEYKP